MFILLVEKKVLGTSRLKISALNHLCCQIHAVRVLLKYSLALSEICWSISMNKLKIDPMLIDVLKSSYVAGRQDLS